MRICIVLLSVCIATSFGLPSAQVVENKGPAYQTVCFAETGVNPELVKKAYERNEWENDNNLHCYALCLMNKWGWVDAAQGIWIPDAIRASINKAFPNGNADAVLAKCHSGSPLATCDNAYLIAKCWNDLRIANAAAKV
ncbi:general odorant-binding protein 99a [Fopius arisanus]|uniref:General odorant-binding protein 99a n=1 Tax=Fopius arisanus TaxID=64838 RepID=A0A0C9R2J1_9HYME|nr:PREDICTED: general odorant-binding protein 99a-like [Fopius arisanus]